jgi:glycosyltransferase involved in cell wall biosynthesis
MFRDKKVIVIMPTYNAQKTLVETYDEVMDQEIVDLIVIVDDMSQDNTVNIAENLSNTIVYKHESNIGYGGNQKTCYRLALEARGDIIIMLHPDYQYPPKPEPIIFLSHYLSGPTKVM